MAKQRKPKALTRKVTRKRALSYDRMAPNKRGVTALSEVNGPGAYERRYAATRRMLRNEGDAMARSKTWEGKMYRKQLRDGRSPAQARATVRMVKAAKRKAAGGGRRRRARKNATPIEYARPRPSRKPASRPARRRPSGTRSSGTKMRGNLRRGGKTVKKADFIREQTRAGRSQAQAEATWKLIRGKQGYKTTRRKQRTYGKGTVKALKARAGSRSKWTYLRRTKKGKTRHIPDYALLGYKSAAAMRAVWKTGTDAERARLGKRMQALLGRREREADKAAKRARKGTAWFSPNAGGEEVLSYEEWKMKCNRRRRTKTSRKRRHTTKKRRVRRNAARKTAQPRGRGGRFVKRRSAKRRTTKKRRTKATAARRTKRTTTRRRRPRKLRRGTKAYKTRIRNLKKGCKTVRRLKANRRGSARRRTHTRRRRYATRAARSYTPNRRRTRKHRRRSYRRNVSGAAFKAELMNAFKYGLIVTGGFVVHRLASNALDKYGLSKIQSLQGSDWRKTISDLVTAAVLVPITVRVLPKHAGVAAAGMAASVLYRLILTGLAKANQPALLEAVSNYPNAPGYPQYSGYGSYYAYSPHQVFQGYGEFYETSPVPGLEQAAANGYGQAPPQLQQMYANPMGEYYAYGLHGIGEYEAAPSAMSGMGAYVDDGIMPNTHTAEQMLDVAEAAAGVGAFGQPDVYGQMLTQAAAGYQGFGDVPLQSTVDPMIRAMDIPDMPGGSRAGILAGGDGIFG